MAYVAGRSVAFALAVVCACALGEAFPTADATSLAHGSASKSGPQRCGDDIHFFFDDRAGKNIDPAKFESVTVHIDNESARRAPQPFEKNRMKGLRAPTLCGIDHMNVKAAYRGQVMELIIRRIPGDRGDAFIYHIPFAEGTYEFDFEYDFDRHCEDNAKGWHGACKISPKRLKRVTTPGGKEAGRPSGSASSLPG